MAVGLGPQWAVELGKKCAVMSIKLWLLIEVHPSVLKAITTESANLCLTSVTKCECTVVAVLNFEMKSFDWEGGSSDKDGREIFWTQGHPPSWKDGSPYIWLSVVENQLPGFCL